MVTCLCLSCACPVPSHVAFCSQCLDSPFPRACRDEKGHLGGRMFPRESSALRVVEETHACSHVLSTHMPTCLVHVISCHVMSSMCLPCQEQRHRGICPWGSLQVPQEIRTLSYLRAIRAMIPGPLTASQTLLLPWQPRTTQLSTLFHPFPVNPGDG